MPAAIAPPIRTPQPASVELRRITIATTPAGDAPRATRIPISLDGCFTKYEVTPYIPESLFEHRAVHAHLLRQSGVDAAAEPRADLVPKAHVLRPPSHAQWRGSWRHTFAVPPPGACVPPE